VCKLVDVDTDADFTGPGETGGGGESAGLSQARRNYGITKVHRGNDVGLHPVRSNTFALPGAD
jgi:hypothetical protein